MLILASNSPRRKEILHMLGYNFAVISPDCDENLPPMSPAETVCELSKRKALAVSLEADDTVIGSDTIVCFEGNILGKPADKADAVRMLKALSGNMHTVYTGVTVANNKKIITDFISADVFFRRISDKEITKYIDTNEPMDKAGAYGIQGKGAAFVTKINGDFYTVMGLPACHISTVLSSFGIYPENM